MNDIAKKETVELKRLVAEKREALRVFRFDVSGSKMRNVREGRTIRKEVATILTELRKRIVK